jgi:hypothetical protein
VALWPPRLGAWLAANVDPTKNASHDARRLLPDWCPNWNASSRWQELARIPEAEIASYVAGRCRRPQTAASPVACPRPPP